MERINLHLINAIQRAYTAGIEYLTCLRQLNKSALKGQVDVFDIESVVVAYAAMKAAQWDLNSTLDGGMKDSKN